MKIGVLGDVHGNYQALKAVLEDIKLNEVDNFIVLGDIFSWGTEPQKCYETIR